MSNNRLAFKVSANDMERLNLARVHLGLKKVAHTVPLALAYFVDWYRSDKRPKRWRPSASQNADQLIQATVDVEYRQAFVDITEELFVSNVILGQNMMRLWLSSLNLPQDVQNNITDTNKTISNITFDCFKEQDDLFNAILEHNLVDSRRSFIHEAIEAFHHHRATGGEFQYESRPLIPKGEEPDNLVRNIATMERPYFATVQYYTNLDGRSQRDVMYNIFNFRLDQYKVTHGHILGAVDTKVEAFFHVHRSSMTGLRVLKVAGKFKDLNTFFINAIESMDIESLTYIPRPVPEDDPVQPGDLVQKVDPEMFLIERLAPLVPAEHYQRLEHQAQTDGVHIQTVCFNVFEQHLARELESS